jgi:phage head maturation protease
VVIRQRSSRAPQDTARLRVRGILRIGGRAANFGQPSEPLPGPYGAAFIEVIAKSFFNKSRGDGWPGVTARFMHRDDMILGATRSGTLQLTINPAVGLDYTVSLPQSRSDIYELVERGDIGESSFSFITSGGGDAWDFDHDSGMPLRTLISGRLIDVAPVTQGAYTQTSCSLRSLARYMDASEQDVTDAALAGELRRFFTRSDRQKVFPPKPVGGSGSQRSRRRMSAKQRQVEVLAWRWGTPLTEKQQAVQDMKLRSGRSALLDTLAARWPEPHRKPKNRKQIQTELQGRKEPGYDE